jgi:hypothetical protein|tara:strand:- start:480 stop:641 length:162 start_codon:yes stop_codon:yes gene_type:complete
MAKKVKETVYKRLAINAGQNKFFDFGEKVKKGELEYTYYAMDNSLCYFYYKVL